MNVIKNDKLTISYADWISYIKIKKQKILKNIDTTSILDNSTENKIFINILKNIFNTDIFDISKIGYISFSFLDTYINEYLINILKNDKQVKYYFLNNNDTTTRCGKDTCKNCSYNKNNTIKLNDDLNNILELIINFIIQTEFTLNLHLFLIIYLLQNKHKKSAAATASAAAAAATETESESAAASTASAAVPKLLKPTILLKFEQICNTISINIKSSSFILLLLKLNYKLTNLLDNINTHNYNNIIQKELEFIKHFREVNNKINLLLDAFILEITKIIENSENKQLLDNDIIEKYSICVNYILDLGTLFYSSFDKVFEIFIKYLKKEYPDNKKFDIIKLNISNFIKQELTILENTLLSI